MQPLEILRSVPLFRDLPKEDLGQLGHHLRPFSVGREATIVSREETGSSLYLISHGKVKVVLQGRSGREVILAVLKDSDFFGEMSLLDGEKRSASVIAISETDLLVLDRADFVQWILSRPTVSLHLLAEMSRRLREANARIGSLTLLDVYGRVARTLLDLGKKEGSKVPEGILIAERPTQTEIAGMSGTSRETVSRTMADLARRGYIRAQGRSIFLLGTQQLEEELLG